jgi:CHASE2 domain-containing sensor protein
MDCGNVRRCRNGSRGSRVVFYRAREFFISLSYDLPFVVRRQAIPDDVVIVYLDEMSHRVMEQPLNAPWDRTKHAELLRRLTDGGAKCVVFDILFTDPDKEVPERDSKFRDAIRAHGNVVLGGDLSRGRATDFDRSAHSDASRSRRMGLVNFIERDFLGARAHSRHRRLSKPALGRGQGCSRSRDKKRPRNLRRSVG